MSSSISPLSWWRKLQDKRRKSPGKVVNHKNERVDSSILEEETVSGAYCRHFRVRKSIARFMYKLRGRTSRDSVLKNCCPICGLPVKGDRRVEYVLTVWFGDGSAHEYHFRNRREEDCYEIAESVLKVFLGETAVHFPLHAIGTIEFSTQEIPPDSSEVVEAIRIISAAGAEK